MFTHYKALAVVLALATLVFVLAKPICLRFTAPEDFARRRLLWYVLTITAFVSPNIWLYVLVAAPLIAWAAKMDSTPAALFPLLMFVIPPISIQIPIVGINRLFELNNWRILGFMVLVPTAIAQLRRASDERPFRITSLDLLLMLYMILQLALLMPYESITNTMRRCFLLLLDEYVLFFVFSRALHTKRNIADAMGALCLAAAIFAPLAAFESLRGWLLYTQIDERWGSPNSFAWLLRGDSLRAQVSTGHSIGLGYILAMAIGFWMYLKATEPRKMVNAAVIGLLSTGLFFSYARGPWIAAALSAMIFVALGSKGAANFFKGALVIAAIVAVIGVTPLGDKIVENLPFIGTQGQETVAYRQQLAETSWLLVQQNPIFGNPFVMLNMEELRQGQGIIDIVNAYAQVALFHGLVGLALFVGVFLIALRRGYSQLRRSRVANDIDMVWLGASLLACMVSTLVYMVTAGSPLQWMLAGLLVSYAALPVTQSIVSADPTLEPSAFRPRSVSAA